MVVFCRFGLRVFVVLTVVLDRLSFSKCPMKPFQFDQGCIDTSCTVLCTTHVLCCAPREHFEVAPCVQFAAAYALPKVVPSRRRVTTRNQARHNRLASHSRRARSPLQSWLAAWDASALNGRANRSSVPTAKTGTKTSELVAFGHATNSRVFVPGFAVGKIGNPNLSG